MKNTGKHAQDAFDAHWRALGKIATVIPYEDQAALYGLNKKLVRSAAKPCDRILIFRGKTEFCEIKSSHDKTAFRFSQIEQGQLNYATKISAAGGDYNFYIWSYVRRRWAVIAWPLIAAIKGNNVESMKWSAMDPFIIPFTEPTE